MDLKPSSTLPLEQLSITRGGVCAKKVENPLPDSVNMATLASTQLIHHSEQKSIDLL